MEAEVARALLRILEARQQTIRIFWCLYWMEKHCEVIGKVKVRALKGVGVKANPIPIWGKKKLLT